MLALMDQTHEPFVADEAEAVVARAAADRLRAVAKANQNVEISIDNEDARIVVPLPAAAVAMFHAVLEAMARRTPISIIPYDAELSTQQSADFLNISRPYLVRKLEAGDLPFRKVGTHRRIRFSDLVAYERRRAVEQETALANLHDEARRLGLE
ncbi:helix-turn-helix domain-containing protein [Amaricoccus solimangrovi]|uniref:Helix-turn-helix domain-containing protein n=1 Tax=Amaricoccus solimangrovi TaxID=2589815 RepID=A0A501WHQ6_9RHOB|nr:helix-turn-helix domain-containing protein [Amaricoccus solimangrovi]